MRYDVVDGLLVDKETGEVVDPIYEVVEYKPKPDPYYDTTRIAPEECTDTDQLKRVMKCVTDMRGVKIVSGMVWFKKESDYGVRTLKQKSLISNTQMKTMESIISLLVYKNIVLCSRAELCKVLDCDDKHLNRKLDSVKEWIKIGKAKRGFMKIFVSPSLGYKGKLRTQDSAFTQFYKDRCVGREQFSKQHNIVFSREMEAYLFYLRNSAPKSDNWFEDMLSKESEKDSFYDVDFERNFLKSYYSRSNK